LFWRDALALRRGQALIDKRASPLFCPRAQVDAMECGCRASLITAAIDNSDGLLPTLDQFALASGLGIELDLEKLTVADCPSAMDPARLWLGWGDWNVITAVHPDRLRPLSELCKKIAPILPVGRFTDGPAYATVRRGSKKQRAPRLESERFARDSWFTSGIEGYVQNLLGAALP
jgi:thiamine-monophosphate kinase